MLLPFPYLGTITQMLNFANRGIFWLMQTCPSVQNVSEIQLKRSAHILQKTASNLPFLS